MARGRPARLKDAGFQVDAWKRAIAARPPIEEVHTYDMVMHGQVVTVRVMPSASAMNPLTWQRHFFPMKGAKADH